MGTEHPALARIRRDESGGADLPHLLGDQMAGSDLVTLLLDVARRRADRRSAVDVGHQYRSDRFVAPAAVDPIRMARLEHAAIDRAASTFAPVTLSPVVPLGTHAVLGGVDQHNVLSTIRGTEVAADPTTALALEAAERRRVLLDEEPRSSTPVRLAAVQRVLRAQRFDGPRSFAHFSLLGLVTAGRDVGDLRFETVALEEHLDVLTAITLAAGADAAVVRLSGFDDRHRALADRIIDDRPHGDVRVEAYHERTAGRGYYPSLCLKVDAVVGGEVVEVGDGGLVDWTQHLLQNRKERLFASGISLERLVLLDDDRGT